MNYVIMINERDGLRFGLNVLSSAAITEFSMKRPLLLIMTILPVLSYSEISSYPVVVTESDHLNRITVSRYNADSYPVEEYKLKGTENWEYTYYFYDESGDLTQEIVLTVDNTAVTNTYSNVYQDGLLKYIYNDEWSEEYFYNDSGQVAEIYHDHLFDTGQTYYLAYDYNDEGYLSEEYFEYSDEIFYVYVYDYDEQGRILADYLDNSNVYYRKIEYEYDDGTLPVKSSYISFLGSITGSEYEYEYDNVGRLIREKRSDEDGCWKIVTYDYEEIEDRLYVYQFVTNDYAP